MPSTTTPKATAASSTDRTADRNEKPMTTASATVSLESLRRGAQKLGGILLGVFLLFAVYASIMSLLFSEPAAGAYEHPTFGLIEFRSNGLGAWQRSSKLIRRRQHAKPGAIQQKRWMCIKCSGGEQIEPVAQFNLLIAQQGRTRMVDQQCGGQLRSAANHQIV